MEPLFNGFPVLLFCCFAVQLNTHAVVELLSDIPMDMIVDMLIDQPESADFKCVVSFNSTISRSKKTQHVRRLEDSEGNYKTLLLLQDKKDEDIGNLHFIHPIYTTSVLENHEGKLSTLPEEIKAVDDIYGRNEPVFYTISKASDSKFKTQLKIKFNEYIHYNQEYRDRPVIFWEAAKAVLRGEIIAYNAMRNKKLNLREQELNNAVINSYNRLLITKNSVNWAKYIRAKNDKDTFSIYRESQKDLKLQSKLYRYGNKSGKLLARLVKSDKKSSFIEKLYSGGKLLTENEDIYKEMAEYYQELYTSRDSDPSQAEAFWSKICCPKVSEEAIETINAPIIVEEIEKMISESAMNKASGPDGLPNEFYKILLSETAPYLCNLFNAMYIKGEPAIQLSYMLKSADAVVLVRVLDENDNPPQFSQSVYETSLPENTPSGSIALIVTVTDKDEGGFHGNLTIIPKDSPFQISDLGIITVNHSSELDRERNKCINFQVWAFDTNRLNSSAMVVINLLDVNDNNPEFQNLPLIYTIPEGDYRTGTPVTVGHINATDMDEGLNGQIIIHSPDEEGDDNFLVLQNGTIIAHGFIDREVKGRYILPVIASDNGTPPRKNFADIMIVIKDVNDNAPYFPKHEYFKHIALANVKKGDPVLTVSATDSDIGNNSLISYSLSQNDHYFIINSSNGEISLASNLPTVSTATALTLKVIAADHGVPSMSSTATVYVTITVNDTEFGLQFANSHYNFSISEEEPEGIEIGAVRALSGNAKSLITYLVKTYTEIFSITNEGHIVTRVTLDRENQSSYDMIVEATDSQEPPSTAATLVWQEEREPSHMSWDSCREELLVLRRTKLVVTVFITDVNDNPPIFSPLINTNINCPENEDFLDFGHISATDKDTGKNGFITYLLENDFNGTFYINTSTGRLATKKPLDADTVANYNLKVIAMDSGSPPLSSSVLLHITVQDVNDNPPVFQDRSISVTVKENQPPHVILNVLATDQDTGNNAQILYSFTISSSLFYIGENSGSLSTLQPLDYEKYPQYTLEVIAYNPENTHLQSTATVIVHVEDMNDEGPTFEHPTYNKVMLNKSSYPGSLVIDLNVTDEKDGIHYSITDGNSEGLFVISNSTGHIFLIKDLPKHNNLLSYALTITATDIGVPPLSTATKVFVTIASSNVSVPVFSADYYTAEPLSDSALPSTVVIQTSALYNKPLYYYFTSGNDKDYFSIDPFTGTIRTKKVLNTLDFPIDLRVRVTDSTNLNIFSEALVHVTVIDDNKFAPVFPAPVMEVKLKEEQPYPLLITQLHAVDNDTGKNGRLTYKILNGNFDKFKINALNGKLFAERKFDFENDPKEYQIVVLAEDDGKPNKKQGYCTVVVHIADINDFKPVFEPTEKMLVKENAPIGTVIGKVTATDMDSGDNAFIQYTLLDEDDQFEIDRLSGTIFIKNLLDYETKHRSVLTVQATNSKAAPFYQTNTSLTIDILDINDNAPEFMQKQYFSEVYLNSPVGTPVAVVQARDSDQAKNGMIEYHLLPNSALSKYFLFENEKHGKLITAKSGLKPGKINVTVLAKDRGDPSLNSTASVIVNVLSKILKQKSLPEFKQNELSTIVKQNKSGIDHVYTFAAKAPFGKNVTYRIVAGDELDHFILDGRTGELWTKAKLNPRLQTHNLIVQAFEMPDTNLQGPLPKNMAQLKITVEDANEAPVFEKQLYEAEIFNSVPYEYPVVKVVAKYPHLMKNASIVYSMVNQSGDEFDIDKYTGQIFAKSLNGETGTYYFRVQAMGQGGLSAQTLVKITLNDVSQDVVDLKINQTVDTMEPFVPKVIRILENILHQNVSITNIFSNATNMKKEKEEETTISFQTFDKDGHLVPAEHVIRNLIHNITNIMKKKLEQILKRPVDISISEHPKPPLSQAIIIAITTSVLMVCTLIGLGICISRKKSPDSENGGGDLEKGDSQDPEIPVVSQGPDDESKAEKQENGGQRSEALDNRKTPEADTKDAEKEEPKEEVKGDLIQPDEKSKDAEDETIIPETDSKQAVEEKPKEEGDMTQPDEKSKIVMDKIKTPETDIKQTEQEKPEEEAKGDMIHPEEKSEDLIDKVKLPETDTKQAAEEPKEEVKGEVTQPDEKSKDVMDKTKMSETDSKEAVEEKPKEEVKGEEAQIDEKSNDVMDKMKMSETDTKQAAEEPKEEVKGEVTQPDEKSKDLMDKTTAEIPDKPTEEKPEDQETPEKQKPDEEVVVEGIAEINDKPTEENPEDQETPEKQKPDEEVEGIAEVPDKPTEEKPEDQETPEKQKPDDEEVVVESIITEVPDKPTEEKPEDQETPEKQKPDEEVVVERIAEVPDKPTEEKPEDQETPEKQKPDEEVVVEGIPEIPDKPTEEKPEDQETPEKQKPDEDVEGIPEVPDKPTEENPEDQETPEKKKPDEEVVAEGEVSESDSKGAAVVELEAAEVIASDDKSSVVGDALIAEVPDKPTEEKPEDQETPEKQKPDEEVVVEGEVSEADSKGAAVVELEAAEVIASDDKSSVVGDALIAEVPDKPTKEKPEDQETPEKQKPDEEVVVEGEVSEADSKGAAVVELEAAEVIASDDKSSVVGDALGHETKISQPKENKAEEEKTTSKEGEKEYDTVEAWESYESEDSDTAPKESGKPETPITAPTAKTEKKDNHSQK
ncbi:protocadherin Fat 4-like [Bombina bombina]|uniref:protocadherin Fat 4-like n=1 Tax=Bombina bombina TaxID=8345 RepID=UPI00235A7177|nr:protocadherin Fat 4-like [Bombina bombina]